MVHQSEEGIGVCCAITSSKRAAYYSIGDAAINCGSVANSTGLDGREWIGEAASSMFPSGESRISTAAEKPSFSIDPVPYKTSRISSTEFGYSFQVNPDGVTILITC
ncbi:hypothetical protein ACH5RR_016406 [Cinchona calisaya]|uniref:Uncharacterized protein n=1 Tax=Cinchona calisaya TaxID=153742 RepID=A0ABD2ZVY6_9GENT